MKTVKTSALMYIGLLLILIACKHSSEKKGQQLSVREVETITDSNNSLAGLKGGASFKQINTAPNSLLLTGIDMVRLITIYKVPQERDKNIAFDEGTTYLEDDNYAKDEDYYRYFMPGIDIINGYNLVNIGHYNLVSDSLTYFFNKPVLIKTLYFPGVKKDSLNGRLIIRNFFLASIYNEDTNKDAVINNKDLRRFVFIDGNNANQVNLLPNNYSAIKSTYDFKNDIMFIYARHDENDNGIAENTEPVSIFMINLSKPSICKKMI